MIRNKFGLQLYDKGEKKLGLEISLFESHSFLR